MDFYIPFTFYSFSGINSQMARAFIGTSGYNYGHWRSVFYPPSLSPSKWLEHYCQFFSSVELNVTFYRLPQTSAFKGWYKRTPPHFSFALKGSRFITHIKKLGDCQEPLDTFAERVGELREKVGVILWQFPPRFKFDREKLEGFLSLLSSHPLTRNWRHSFEFRDISWFCPSVYHMLREHNFSLALADWPFILQTTGKPQEVGIIKYKARKVDVEETADFIYLRRHGAVALYASDYSEEELQRDAQYIKRWLEEGRDVFVYFNNDAYGFAVKNALRLKELVEGGD